VIEWAGFVPVHWGVSSAKMNFLMQLGKMLQNDSAGQQDVEIAYLKALHVNWNEVTTQELPKMWASPQDIEKYEVENGDLLVCEGGEVGRASILDGLTEPAIIQNALHRLRNTPRGKVGYFAYLLKHIADAGWFGILCNKATIAHLTGEKLGAIQMPVPSPGEQEKIAAFLDWKTGQIDALIAKKQALIEKLKEKRLTVITQAVTKGLDASVPLRDSHIPWLGLVPKNWVVGGFTKFVLHRADYRGKTPEKVKDGVFLVTARNIKSGHIDYEISQEFVLEDEYEQIMSRGKPVIGDLLFTTEAPLGEVANIDREDIALAQRVIKFRGEPDKLNNYFAKYWMMSVGFQSDLMSLATGSTAKGIKASKLFALRCVIPPLDEQGKIVEYLDRKLSDFDEMENKVIGVIDKLIEYRTALITAAITGQIDVRNVEIPAQA